MVGTDGLLRFSTPVSIFAGDSGFSSDEVGESWLSVPGRILIGFKIDAIDWSSEVAFLTLVAMVRILMNESVMSLRTFLCSPKLVCDSFTPTMELNLRMSDRSSL
ncbi:hypothetical protein OGATHE_004767 [Ogataea polymorpha]|uniref:Uncharacterized protein n=1 Tax=Ogataea polymorpha TaxID=460523 RepID=A0A9P8P1E1_9ASCO|nr:hypothetical protein OGATHE_004767 [Ogataea polymorpha]